MRRRGGVNDVRLMIPGKGPANSPQEWLAAMAQSEDVEVATLRVAAAMVDAAGEDNGRFTVEDVARHVNGRGRS